ncbi:hypothetical protein BRD04_00855 [Halobacteriales archaeon QS_9_67_17]|nr:MAG: hypothetical protein BRD04_00855 [Halobacteriales archaeon QS_9_67_17]
MRPELSRRRLIGTLGVAAVTITSGGDASAANGWTEVSSPTAKTLYDVASASDGPYAAGGSGVLVHRGSDGWEIVLADGPSGNNKTLEGVGVTGDGARVWVAGASGRLGSYAVTDGTVRDYSKPNGFSDNLHDVEVVGPVGGERIYAAAGSGNVLVGTRQADGSFDWSLIDTGGKNTVTAVDFYGRDVGRAVTTGPAAFTTTDGGSTWTDVTPDSAADRFFGVVSADGNVWVGADNGRIWRRNCTCAVWTPHRPDTKAVRALSYRGGRFLGSGESGRVFERADGGWVARETPVGDVLLGCLPGAPDVAVGKSGTIVER